MTWESKKALVARTIQTERLYDILPQTTVRPNGSVYVGRESTGKQAIVIIVESGGHQPATVDGTEVTPPS